MWIFTIWILTYFWFKNLTCNFIKNCYMSRNFLVDLMFSIQSVTCLSSQTASLTWRFKYSRQIIPSLTRLSLKTEWKGPITICHSILSAYQSNAIIITKVSVSLNQLHFRGENKKKIQMFVRIKLARWRDTKFRQKKWSFDKHRYSKPLRVFAVSRPKQRQE